MSERTSVLTRTNIIFEVQIPFPPIFCIAPFYKCKSGEPQWISTILTIQVCMYLKSVDNFTYLYLIHLSSDWKAAPPILEYAPIFLPIENALCRFLGWFLIFETWYFKKIEDCLKLYEGQYKAIHKKRRDFPSLQNRPCLF